MEYSVATYTDAGTQGAPNQDSICVRRAITPNGEELLMAVLCDGVGDMNKGELASAVCVRAFEDWFDRFLPQLQSCCAAGLEWVHGQWKTLAEEVHQELMEYGTRTGQPLATTLAAFFAHGDSFLTANVGDTRIYTRGKEFRRLTQDHSLIAQEVAKGRITEEEARNHPQRNVLLRCLGRGNAVEPAFSIGKLQGGILVFLCTDGYLHELPEGELETALSPICFNGKSAMTDTLGELAKRCRERGETDDISGILICPMEKKAVPKATGFHWTMERLRAAFSKQEMAPVGPVLLETTESIHTREQLTGAQTRRLAASKK